MAITSKGSAWEWKNSWFILLALILPITFIPFLIMYGRTKALKFLFKGIFTMLIVFILFMGPTFAQTYETNNRMSEPAGAPVIFDYVGDDYYKNPDYKETEEYKEYQKALSKYQNTAKYKEYEDYNTNIHQTRMNIQYVARTGSIIVLLVIAIMAIFVDRPSYLRLLSEIEDKRSISQAMQKRRTTPPVTNSPAAADYLNNAGNNAPPDNRAVETQSIDNNAQAVQAYNVNNMTEQEFSQIPLLNVIDIKKIMSFRETNGSFSSKEQFFESFDAKPHVIAKLTDSVYVETPQSQAKADTNYSSRKFDL